MLFLDSDLMDLWIRARLWIDQKLWKNNVLVWNWKIWLPINRFTLNIIHHHPALCCQPFIHIECTFREQGVFAYEHDGIKTKVEKLSQIPPYVPTQELYLRPAAHSEEWMDRGVLDLWWKVLRIQIKWPTCGARSQFSTFGRVIWIGRTAKLRKHTNAVVRGGHNHQL